MTDREKVIKGLETCIPMKYETNEEKECRHKQCPYGRENYKPMNGCFWDLMSDALALLKEQSRKQMSSFGDGYAEGYKAKEQEIVRCKDCKHIWWFSEKNGDAVCGNGRHKPDWFCADGERRTD